MLFEISALELLAAALLFMTCTIQLWNCCRKTENEKKKKKTEEKAKEKPKDSKKKKEEADNEKDDESGEKKSVRKGENQLESNKIKQMIRKKEIASKSQKEDQETDTALMDSENQKKDQLSNAPQEPSSAPVYEGGDNADNVPWKSGEKLVIVEGNESVDPEFDDFVTAPKQDKKEGKDRPDDGKNESASEKAGKESAKEHDARQKFDDGAAAGEGNTSFKAKEQKKRKKQKENARSARAGKRDDRVDDAESDLEEKANKAREDAEEAEAKSDGEANRGEKRQLLVPKKFAKGLKETKIAKGAHVGKRDYQTMDDVESDWGSEGGEENEAQRKEKIKSKASCRGKGKVPQRGPKEPPPGTKETPPERKEEPQEAEAAQEKHPKSGRKCLIESKQVSVKGIEGCEKEGVEPAKQKTAPQSEEQRKDEHESRSRSRMQKNKSDKDNRQKFGRKYLNDSKAISVNGTDGGKNGDAEPEKLEIASTPERKHEKKHGSHSGNQVRKNHEDKREKQQRLHQEKDLESAGKEPHRSRLGFGKQPRFRAEVKVGDENQKSRGLGDG